MKTKIAEELKKIRLGAGENLRTMAEKLGVSSAFISAVENGKKNLPENILMRMKEVYALSDETIDQLRTAALESQKNISINIEKTSDENRELAVCFARQFKDIDAEANKQIMEILRRRRNND